VEILARLVGDRVKCGMPNESGATTCFGDIARVAEWHGIRLLCIPDGWKRKTGEARDHWTLTNHSVSLRDVTASKVSRRKLAPDQASARSRPRNRRPIGRVEGDANLAAYGIDSVSAVFEWIPAAGILSDCPRCGHVNTLMASELGLAQG
jgi:hypothetical protein